MNAGPGVSRKRRGLFALAIAAFLCGVVAMVAGFNDPLALAFAGLMIVASVQLTKASKVYPRGRSDDLGSGDAGSDGHRHIGFLAWALGGVSAAAVIISLFFLYEDAVNGYHGIWPVYAFAASGLVAAVVLSYLFAKLRN